MPPTYFHNCNPFPCPLGHPLHVFVNPCRFILGVCKDRRIGLRTSTQPQRRHDQKRSRWPPRAEAQITKLASNPFGLQLFILSSFFYLSLTSKKPIPILRT